MEFPTQYLGQLRKQNKLHECLNTLADICAGEVAKNTPETTEKFSREYLRAVNSDLLPEESPKLRAVVADIIFSYRTLRNSSIETQWDIVCVYGGQNYHRVIEYLDSLPQFFHPKMKRLLQVCVPNKMAAAIVFNSSFIDILDKELMVPLKQSNPEISLIAHHYDAGPDVAQLRMLFPQLSVSRAQRLLKNSTLEQATQKMLDDGSAGKKKERKIYEPLVKNTYTPDYNKTLQLAYTLLEDDDFDQEMKAPTAQQTQSRKLWLSQVYTNEPELFSKSMRGSLERGNFLERLNSDGWLVEAHMPANWTDEVLENWGQKLEREKNKPKVDAAKKAEKGSASNGSAESKGAKPPSKDKAAKPHGQERPKDNATQKSGHKDKAKEKSQNKAKGKSQGKAQGSDKRGKHSHKASG